jgi:hypothetical protein
MLTVEEIIEAVVSAQAVGQRPHGHFDHNANCATGPHVPSGDRIEPPAAEMPPTGTSSEAFDIRYEATPDPGTGGLLYRALGK